MVSRRITDGQNPKAKRRPATTPEQRENQLIALAADLAEKQMREGTASSQVMTHYLKLGSTREKLEQERLRMENELSEAKIKAMASVERIEELYGKAIAAMRDYAGHDQPAEQDYDEG